jgi:hypothetical protein
MKFSEGREHAEDDNWPSSVVPVKSDENMEKGTLL